jgi:hypothetical protein
MSADSADNLNELSHQMIGMAIEIHKKLGPGFQEKIYEEALLKEFEKAEIECLFLSPRLLNYRVICMLPLIRSMFNRILLIEFISKQTK